MNRQNRLNNLKTFQNLMLKRTPFVALMFLLLSVSPSFAAQPTLLADVGIEHNLRHLPPDVGNQLEGRKVFLTSEHGRMYALEAATGFREWSKRFVGETTYPVRLDKDERQFGPPRQEQRSLLFIFEIGRPSRLVALYEDNGETYWSVDIEGEVYYTPPAVSTDYICYGTVQNGQTYIDARDTETSKRRWKYQVKGQIIEKIPPLIVSDDMVYITCRYQVEVVSLREGNLLGIVRTNAPIGTKPVVIPGMYLIACVETGRGSEICVYNIRNVQEVLLFRVELQFPPVDLENGDILEDLRQAFENHQIRLSPDVSVEVVQENSEWLINDTNNRTYVVVREEEALNIYPVNQSLTSFELPGRVSLPPQLYGGRIVVLTNQGKVAWFSLNTMNPREPIVPLSSRYNRIWFQIPGTEELSSCIFGINLNKIFCGRDDLCKYEFRPFEDPPISVPVCYNGIHEPDIEGIIIPPMHRIGQVIYFRTAAERGRKLLYAIDSEADSSWLCWRVATSGSMYTPPILGPEESDLFVVTGGHSVHRINLPESGDVERPDPEHAARVLFPRLGEYQPLVAGNGFAVGSNLFYVGTHEQKVYAIDFEGERRWEYVIDGVLETPPTLSQDASGREILYFGTTPLPGSDYSTTAVYALLSESDDDYGREAFFSYIPSGNTTGFLSQPWVTESTVYIGDDSGYLLALEKVAGEEPYFEERWREPFHASGAIRSAIVMDGDTLYFGTEEGYLYAIREEGGVPRRRWQMKTDGPIRCTPVILDGVIYVSTINGSIYAIRNGENVWDEPVRLNEKTYASPVLDPRRRVLYIGSTDQYVYQIDIDSGQSTPLFRLESSIETSVTLNGDGTVLYVVSSDGRIYSYNLP